MDPIQTLINNLENAFRHQYSTSTIATVLSYYYEILSKLYDIWEETYPDDSFGEVLSFNIRIYQILRWSETTIGQTDGLKIEFFLRTNDEPLITFNMSHEFGDNFSEIMLKIENYLIRRNKRLWFFQTF